MVMASEVGVLEIPPEEIVLKGRLEPGKMFLVDLEEGRIVDDEELKHADRLGAALRQVARREHGPAGRPARGARTSPAPTTRPLLQRQQAFGYTLEDLKYILGPMGNNGEEAIGSMGTDTPLAVLSDRPQLLFNYFKQLFAQVTNPPLDAIREELVTSMFTGAGGEGNLLDADARELPPDRARHPDPRQRRAGQAQAARRLARVQVGHAADALPRRRGGRGAWSRRSRTLFDQAVRGDRATGPTCSSSPTAASTPSIAPIPSLLAIAGPAPPPGPRGHAHPRRADRRERRRPRGAPLRPAARLRRRARSTRTSRSRRSTR